MYSPPKLSMVNSMLSEHYAAPGFIEDEDSHNRFPLFSTIPDNEVDSQYQGSGSGSVEERDGTIKVPSGSGFRIMTPFPWRLHEMLEEIEQKKMSWIVSWLPCGRAFQVHSVEHFSETIIPMYFRHTRYKSFQRQLYLYGFRALETNTISKGAYFHPCFVKEDRSLCKKIVRPKSMTSNTSTKKRKRNNRLSPQNNFQSSDGENVVIQQMNRSTGCDQVSSSTIQAIVVDRVSPLTTDRSSKPCGTMNERSMLPLQTETIQENSNSPTLITHSSQESLEEGNYTNFTKTRQAGLANPLPNAVWDAKGINLAPPPPVRFPLYDMVSNDSTPEAGPILTMSTSATECIDFELPPSISISDIFHVGTRKTSFKELEVFKDDIISLFGGDSQVQ